jgi:hypothetical protein
MTIAARWPPPPPPRSFTPAIKEKDEGDSDYEITMFTLNTRKKEFISQL